MKWVFGWAAVMALLFPGPGHAQSEADDAAPYPSSAKIIIVSMISCCPDSSWPEAESRTLIEFKTLELDIEVAVIDGVATDENDQRHELEELAEKEGALCAVRIIRSSESGGEVDLWIADRATGKTVTRTIRVEGETEYEGATLVALRLVELFQATLLELNLPGAPKGEVSPSPEIKKMVEKIGTVEKIVEVVVGPPKETVEPLPVQKKEPGNLGLRLGLEAAGSPGATGALGGFMLAFRWGVFKSLSLEMEGTLLFIGEDIRHDDLEARLSMGQLRAWSHWEIFKHRVVRPSLGAGGGLLLFWSKGSSTDRFRGVTDITYAGYVGLSAQLGIVLTKYFWLRLGIDLGYPIPGVPIYFGAEKVATFAFPYIEGFLNAEVKFP